VGTLYNLIAEMYGLCETPCSRSFAIKMRETSHVKEFGICSCILNKYVSLLGKNATIRATKLKFSTECKDFFLPTALPHDNGTGPDLSRSSFYF